MVGLSAIAAVTFLALGLSGAFGPGSTGVVDSDPSDAVGLSDGSFSEGSFSKDNGDGKAVATNVDPQLIISSALATGSGSTNAFATALAETQSKLRQAEAASTKGFDLSWQTGGDDWNREVEAIKGRLSQHEKSLSIDLQSQGEKQ